MTNKIKERNLHRQCNNGFACRNVGYAIQKWMPIIPPYITFANQQLWDVAMCGFRSPNNPLTWICPTMCFLPYFPPLVFPLLSPFLYYASAIFISFDSLSIYMQLYRFVLYILVPCVFFSQTLISLPINKQVQHMGRSSLTGLCGRVWTSIFKDGPSSIFVQKGKGTVERYLSRDLTFALIQIFSLLAPLIIFSSLHFWYPFFFFLQLIASFLVNFYQQTL